MVTCATSNFFSHFLLYCKLLEGKNSILLLIVKTQGLNTEINKGTGSERFIEECNSSIPDDERTINSYCIFLDIKDIIFFLILFYF